VIGTLVALAVLDVVLVMLALRRHAPRSRRRSLLPLKGCRCSRRRPRSGVSQRGDESATVESAA